MAIKNYIIPSLGIICLIGLLVKGPLPQDLSYHDFVDQRSALGIPNFLNVVTNLPFLFIGTLGLNTGRKAQKEMKIISSTLFVGFVLLFLGSAYYH